MTRYLCHWSNAITFREGFQTGDPSRRTPEPGQVARHTFLQVDKATSGQGSRRIGRCSIRVSRVRDLVEMAENLVMCHFPVAMPAFDCYNVEGLRTTAGACQPPMRVVGLVRRLVRNFREQR